MSAVPPPAPRNVRLVDDDGHEVPLEFFYEGLDDARVHRWRAIRPATLDLTKRWALRADEMPPRTHLAVTLDGRGTPDHPRGDD